MSTATKKPTSSSHTRSNLSVNLPTQFFVPFNSNNTMCSSSKIPTSTGGGVGRRGTRVTTGLSAVASTPTSTLRYTPNSSIVTNTSSISGIMDQTESSMSEGYSFFSDLSTGSDTVEKDCANGSTSSSPSSSCIIVNNNNNNNSSMNNNNHYNVITVKDSQTSLDEDNPGEELKTQKGSRSRQKQSSSQPKHVSSINHHHPHYENHHHPHHHLTNLSWSTSEISCDVSKDLSSESNKTSSNPANSESTSSPAANGQQPVSSPSILPSDSMLSSSVSLPSSCSSPNSVHHFISENRNSNHRNAPFTPNVNSFRYPSFISINVKCSDTNNINSDMGRYNAYEYQQQLYQYQKQWQQQHQQQQQQQQKLSQEGCQENCDDKPVNESNLQQQQELMQSKSQPESQHDPEPEPEPAESDAEPESEPKSEPTFKSGSNEDDQKLSELEQKPDEPESKPQQQQQPITHLDEPSSIAITTTSENQKEEKETPSTVLTTRSPTLSTSSSPSETESSSEEEMELPENCHYSPPKSVDRDAASRLAKRLYHLEGFKRSDVCRHLSKNNDFSRVVAEEYLKYFDFEGDTLHGALRKFLTSFCLIGETQERERVLQHFSKRYQNCNPTTNLSTDALHTLTCAIMLLNSDLHGENVGRKMTCNEFIDNLAVLNDGGDFPKDVLTSIYQSIKSEPLQWALDEDSLALVNGASGRTVGFFGPSSSSSPGSTSSSSSLHHHSSGLLGNNPFLKLPNPNTATEYKRGYIMRKCCFDMNGKRTPFGKRGWKMFYATLRDLVLFLHKDEQGFRKNQLYESLHNSIRIHHALATPANDYTKKQHVFRLQTADQSEYLFQTSDAQELQSWIDTINLVAGSLSAPPLPSAVGSQAKKFQKPLLPSSHTKFASKEQLADHESRIQRISSELEEHVSKHPEKGANRRLLNEFAEKQSYLEYELKRYTAYASTLRTKLQQVYGSGALLEGPSKVSSSSLSCKSKPLTQLSIGEEQDVDEEKWAEEGHEYQEPTIAVKPVTRSHR